MNDLDLPHSPLLTLPIFQTPRLCGYVPTSVSISDMPIEFPSPIDRLPGYGSSRALGPTKFVMFVSYHPFRLQEFLPIPRYSPGNNVLGTAIWSFPKIGGYSICSIPNPIAVTMKNPNRFRNPSHQLSPTPQLQATASPLGPASPPVPPPPPSRPSKSAPAAAPAPPGVVRRAGSGA